MREPKVQTGKRTMVYMATSLAITAGGLLVCYLLFNIKPVEGKTLNAILARRLSGPGPWAINCPHYNSIRRSASCRSRPGGIHRRSTGHVEHGH